MQEVNFLPQRYHEEAANRQGKLWHLLVIVLFGSIISSAALFQFAVRKRVAVELAEVMPQHEAATQTLAELDQLQKELSEIAASARLCVYLEGRWPATQVLSSAVAGLPDSVQLTQLHLSRQNLSGGGTFPGDRLPTLPGQSSGNEEESAAAGYDAERDLEALQDSVKDLQTVVLIEGVTSDSAALYLYTSLLAYQPLLSKAELISLEGRHQDDRELSNFSLRLIVRPAYGEPAGPAGPPPADHETLSRTESTP